MAPNSGYYGTPFPGGWSALKGAPIPGGWSALMGEDFLNSKIQEILGNGNKLTENIGQTSNRDPLMTETVVPGGLTQKQLIEQLESFKALDALAKREELGYPTPSAPVQGVTSTDIPAQTGMRPDPRIVGREEMVAENIKRALGRNRMMMAPVVPGSLNQEQFMKELKEIQALTTPAPAPTPAENTGSISDILGAPQRVYDPEQGRFVPKWDLSKIDPRYGLQSYEAIQSYLERMENQPQVAPREVAAAAARQAPVSPAAARPSSPAPSAQPASSQATTRIGETPQEMLTRIRGGNLAPPNAWTRFVRYRPTSAPGGSVPAPGGAVSRAALSQMLNNLPPDAWARFVRPTNPLTTEK